MSVITRRTARQPTLSTPIAGQAPAFTNPTAAANFPTTREGEIVEFAIPATTGARSVEIYVDGNYYTTVGAEIASAGIRNVPDNAFIEFLIRDEFAAATRINGPIVGATVVPNGEPTGSVTVSIPTTLSVGESIFCDASQLDDSNGIPSVDKMGYRWWRRQSSEAEFTQIGGESNTSAIRDDYIIPPSDSGDYLKCLVTYFDDDGHRHQVFSNEVGPIGAQAVVNQQPTGQPVISGATEVGGTLQVLLDSISDGNGLPGEFDIKWYEDDVEMSGITTLLFEIGEQYEGSKLKVTASYTDLDGFDHTLTSEETTVITSAGNVDPSHYIVDALNGNNSNPGTVAAPWRTIPYAKTQMTAGSVMLLRDTAPHLVQEEALSLVGTSSNKIQIKNYPGEFPVIDASEKGLSWVLHDSATQTYKTTKSNWRSGGVPTGSLEINNKHYALVPYHPKTSLRSSDNAILEKAFGLPDILSQEHDIVHNSIPNYVGPGVCENGGVLYCRLQRVNQASLGTSGDADTDALLQGLVDYNPSSDTNFQVTQTYEIFNFGSACRHIVFDGISFTGAKCAFKMHGSASDITFQNCKFRTNYIGLPSDGASNIIVESCRHELKKPEWVSWTNMKGGVSGQQTMAAVHWAMKCSGVNGADLNGIYIRNCHFERTMDIFVGEGRNIEVSGNTGWVIDDGLQLDVTSEDVHVFNNRLNGVLFGYQGRGAAGATNPGRIYIYGNVIDSRKRMLWGKRDPGNRMRASQSGWNGQKCFSGHGSINSGGGRGFPVQVFNNLMYLGFDQKAADSFGLEPFEDFNDTNIDMNVRNNILIASYGSPFWYKHNAKTNNIDINGNMYFREDDIDGRYHSALGRLSSGTINYSTMAAFVSSADNPGWDADSIYGVDPLINSTKDGLLPGSPALNAGIPNDPSWPSVGHGHIGPFAASVASVALTLVALTGTAISTDSIASTVEYNQPAPARIAYYPTGSPSAELQSAEELSFTYGVPIADGGNGEHNLTISGLSGGTDYTLRAQSTENSGNTWDDIGSPITVTTPANAAFIAIQPDQWVRDNPESTATYNSDWTGSNGFASDGVNTDAFRVQIAQGDNFGASEIFELAGTPKHVVMSYRIFIPSDYTSFWKEADSNLKLPGPAGDVSPANGGYGGSQSSSLAHDQRAWSDRGQLGEPHSTYQDLAVGEELYWWGSTNLGTADPFDDEHGDTIWGSPSGSITGSASLTAGTWHEIEIEIGINDLGVDNGFKIRRLDGVITHQKLDFQFTKSAVRLLVKRLWMDVYMGGPAKVSAGTLSIFMRDFKYKIIT